MKNFSQICTNCLKLSKLKLKSSQSIRTFLLSNIFGQHNSCIKQKPFTWCSHIIESVYITFFQRGWLLGRLMWSAEKLNEESVLLFTRLSEGGWLTQHTNKKNVARFIAQPKLDGFHNFSKMSSLIYN